MSFTLWDEPSSYSLIADDDEVALSVIEGNMILNNCKSIGYYIRIACDMRPGFEARFYKYLAAQVLLNTCDIL